MLKSLFLLSSLLLAASPLLAQQGAQPNASTQQANPPTAPKYPSVQDFHTSQMVSRATSRDPLDSNRVALPAYFTPVGNNVAISDYDSVYLDRMQNDIIPNLMATGSPFLAFWNDTLQALGESAVSSNDIADFFCSQLHPKGTPIYTRINNGSKDAKAGTIPYYLLIKNGLGLEFFPDMFTVFRIVDKYVNDGWYDPRGPEFIMIELNPYIWKNSTSHNWVFGDEATTEKEIKASLTHELGHAFLLAHCPALFYCEGLEEVYMVENIGEKKEITYDDIVSNIVFSTHESFASYMSYLYYNTAFCGQSRSYAQLREKSVVENYIKDYLGANSHWISDKYMLSLMAFLSENENDEIYYNVQKLKALNDLITEYKKTLYDVNMAKAQREKKLKLYVNKMVDLDGLDFLLLAQKEADLGDTALARYFSSLGINETFVTSTIGAYKQQSSDVKRIINKGAYHIEVKKVLDHITTDKLIEEVNYDEIMFPEHKSAAQGAKK